MDQHDAAHIDHLRRLRRLAYSRATTPEERAAAVDAQRQLAVEEARERADEPSPTSDEGAAPAESAETAEPDGSEPVADAGEPPRRRLSRRTLAIVSSAALLVGLGAGAGGAFSAASSIAAQERQQAAADAEPSQELLEQLAVNLRESAVPLVGAGHASQIFGSGDSEAALRWFDTPQRPADVPAGATVENLDPGTTRLVYVNDNYGRVWVARGTDNSFCFYVQSTGAISGLACTDVASFDEGGLNFTLAGPTGPGGVSLRWDGWEVIAITDVHSLEP